MRLKKALKRFPTSTLSMHSKWTAQKLERVGTTDLETRTVSKTRLELPKVKLEDPSQRRVTSLKFSC